MTHYHRPSLKNWKGWPWEFDRILSACLTRGISRTSPIQVSSLFTNTQKVYYTDKTPAEVLASSPRIQGNLSMFKEIWNKVNGGYSPNDLEALVQTAVQEAISTGTKIEGDLVLLHPAPKKAKK